MRDNSRTASESSKLTLGCEVIHQCEGEQNPIPSSGNSRRHSSKRCIFLCQRDVSAGPSCELQITVRKKVKAVGTT